MITGANGFVGRAVCKFLVKSRGYKLETAQTFQCNLLDMAQVRMLVAQVKPKFLIHLAWYVEPGEFWTSSKNFDWQKSTVTLHEEFLRHGGEAAVFAGSCAEYSKSSGLMREEDNVIKPVLTTYGICKLEAAEQILEMSQIKSVPTCWARLFYPYGPEERSEKIVSALIDVFLGKREPFPVSYSDARDFTYVEEVGKALCLLMERRSSGVVNVSTGFAETLEKIISLLSQQFNKYPVTIPRNKCVGTHIIGCNAQLFKLCRWTPSTTFTEVLPAYIKARS